MQNCSSLIKEIPKKEIFTHIFYEKEKNLDEAISHYNKIISEFEELYGIKNNVFKTKKIIFFSQDGNKRSIDEDQKNLDITFTSMGCVGLLRKRDEPEDIYDIYNNNRIKKIPDSIISQIIFLREETDENEKGKIYLSGDYNKSLILNVFSKINYDYK